MRPTLTRRRLAPALALGLAIGAVAVSSAGATTHTTWFGSSLDHGPANAGSTCNDTGGDGTVAPDVCTRVGSFYPGFSGRVKSPADGTITTIRVRAQGPTTVTFRVVRVRDLTANHEAGDVKVLATSRSIDVQGPAATDEDAPVESFPVHLRVHKGDEIAIDSTNNTLEYCSDGTPGQLTIDPRLRAADGFRSATGVDDCLLLVQAVVQH